MNTALVMLEYQNDYFPNGRIPLEKSLDASSKAQTVLNACREKKFHIIHVQHISTQPNASYFLPCTKGADFHATVQPRKDEAIVKKHYPNSFKDTNLLNHLHKQKINQLIFCGMMTHMCIDATVRAAFDLGFSCSVLHDTCTTKTLEFNNVAIPMQEVHYAFLAALHPAYATVLSSEDFLLKIGARNSNKELA